MPEHEESPASVPDPNAFESEEAAIDERLELRAAFSETLTQHGFPDTLVLARERAGDVFHDRRLDLIDYLKEHDPRSVRALAEQVGYDKGVVSRDLQKLASIDLVEYVEDGRAKAPRLKHNHVAIEPVV
ncbi:MAG: helix-turn-helix domain-containing protein [Halapricum sp.]